MEKTSCPFPAWGLEFPPESETLQAIFSLRAPSQLTTKCVWREIDSGALAAALLPFVVGGDMLFAVSRSTPAPSLGFEGAKARAAIELREESRAREEGIIMAGG